MVPPTRIQVIVPADAVVYLMGQRMKTPGTQRSFRLPTIPEGTTFNYPVKVEIVRNGETLSVEHTEQVTAGTTTAVLVVEEQGHLVVKTGTADGLVAAR